MWKPTPDFQNIVQLQRTKRFEEMNKTQERRRVEIMAQFSARGTLRSSMCEIAIIEMTSEAFLDAGTRLMVDYLSLASDVGNEPVTLDWLEEEFCKVIEQASIGLRQAVMEKPLLMSQPLTSEANRAIGSAVAHLKRDASIAFGRVKLRLQRTKGAGTARPVVSMRDYFISHAGEDRSECVDPLVKEMELRGRTVWYSEFEVTLGDSLLRKIDEGLKNSRFGVVVLSPDFFRKPWPRAELDGLAARAAVEGRKVILPVWHRLGHAEVAEHSPSLGGLVGIETTCGIPEVVNTIIAASDREV